MVGNRAFQEGKWDQAEKFYHEGLIYLKNIDNLGEEKKDIPSRIEDITVRKIARYADRISMFLDRTKVSEGMIEEMKIEDDRHRDIAHALSDFLNNLGAVKFVKKEFKSSLLLHKKALKLRIIINGKVSQEVAESFQNLSCVNDALHQYSEAEDLLQSAIEIESKCQAEDSVETVVCSTTLPSYTPTWVASRRPKSF